MSTQPYGVVFRSLREKREWTLDQLAEQFRALGVGVTSRSGVSRLETRGSDRRRILRAYQAVFDVPVSEIEELAAHPEKIISKV